MLEKFINKRLHDLGKEAIAHIVNYDETREDKELTNIYYCLAAIGLKVLSADSRGMDYAMIRDWAFQLAGDTILVIYRNPKTFIHHDNFFFYYRSALKNTSYKMFAYKYALLENFIPLDDYMNDYPMFADVNRADTSIIRRDDCRYLVDQTLNIISKFPRFGSRAKYLVWPIIFSLVDRSDLLLDVPNFRDRIALRLLLRLVEQQLPGRLHVLEE
jgi:hypothetical protein